MGNKIVEPEKNAVRVKCACIAACLLLIYGFALYQRVAEYSKWQQKKYQAAFYYADDEPVLISGDGYYYLRIARDLKDGIYGERDPLRLYPDQPVRSQPAPLLSYLTYAVHTVTGKSMAQVAIFLPAVLGALLIFVIYFLVRSVGHEPLPALLGALFVGIVSCYIDRTRVGFYDTDCLIINLVFLQIAMFVRWCRSDGWMASLYLAVGILSYFLLAWTWDTGRVVALLILVFLLLVSYFLKQSEGAKRMPLAVATAVIIFSFLIGFNDISLLWTQVQGLFALSAGNTNDIFPTVAADVQELKSANFARVVEVTFGWSFLVIISILGLLKWLFDLKRLAVLLIVPLAFGGLTFIAGERFVLFLGPLLAIGLGVAIDYVRSKIKIENQYSLLVVSFGVAVVFCAFILNPLPSVPVPQNQASVERPPIMPLISPSMPAIKTVIEKTEDNAVIWTTWTLGYSLMYYGKRAVVGDAQSLEGDRFVYQNFPLVVDDPKTSANFIQFYVAHGKAGMEQLYKATGGDHDVAWHLLQDVLAVGPAAAGPIVDKALSTSILNAQDMDREQYLDFFFPKVSVPIYILLTNEFCRSTRWFTYGSWDFAKRRGLVATYAPDYNVQVQGDRIVAPNIDLDIDGKTTQEFNINVDGRPRRYTLTHITKYDGKKLHKTVLDENEDMHFEYADVFRFGALMDKELAESVFNKLFIRHRNFKYFQNIVTKTPNHQLWRVTGDKR